MNTYSNFSILDQELEFGSTRSFNPFVNSQQSQLNRPINPMAPVTRAVRPGASSSEPRFAGPDQISVPMYYQTHPMQINHQGMPYSNLQVAYINQGHPGSDPMYNNYPANMFGPTSYYNCPVQNTTHDISSHAVAPQYNPQQQISYSPQISTNPTAAQQPLQTSFPQFMTPHYPYQGNQEKRKKNPLPIVSPDGSSVNIDTQPVSKAIPIKDPNEKQPPANQMNGCKLETNKLELSSLSLENVDEFVPAAKININDSKSKSLQEVAETVVVKEDTTTKETQDIVLNKPANSDNVSIKESATTVLESSVPCMEQVVVNKGEENINDDLVSDEAFNGEDATRSIPSSDSESSGSPTKNRDKEKYLSKERQKYLREKLLDLKKLSSDTTNNLQGLPEIIYEPQSLKQHPFKLPNSPDVFLPNYASTIARHESLKASYSPKPAYGRQNSRRSDYVQSDRKVIPSREFVGIKRSENAYLPNFKQKKTLDELDKLKRNLNSVLNKITPQNFDRCFDELIEFNIKNEENMTTLVEAIFKKAVKEEAYSVTFARLCESLNFLKVTSTENPEKNVTFKSMLVNQCQKMFETPFEEQISMAALPWEEKITLETDESKKKSLEEEKEEAKKKQMDCYFGNIRFIGELFMKDLLKDRIMHHCVNDLLRTGVPEALESVCKLLETVGAKLDNPTSKSNMTKYVSHIEKYIKDCKDNRIKYKLMELLEIKNRGWVLRKNAEDRKIKPMTKDELEKESQRKAIENEREIDNIRRKQQEKGRYDNRYPMGGQISGKSTQNTDEWISVPQRNNRPAAVDTSKMTLKPHATQARLPATNFKSWGTGCSATNSNTPSTVRERGIDNKATPLASQDSRMASTAVASQLKRHVSLHGSRESSRSRDSSPRRLANAFASMPPVRSSADHPNNNINSSVRGGSLRNEAYIGDSNSSLSGDDPLYNKSSKSVSLCAGTERTIPPPSDLIDGLNDKVKYLISEFSNEEYVDADSFRKIHHYSDYFVNTMMNYCMECATKERILAGKFFIHLLKNNYVTYDMATQGFHMFFENIEDLQVDVPEVFKFLAEILQFCIQDAGDNINYLYNMLMPLKNLPGGCRAGQVMAGILVLAAKRLSADIVGNVFRNSCFKWGLLVPEEQVPQFVISNKVEFSMPVSPGISLDDGKAQLLNILETSESTNDENLEPSILKLLEKFDKKTASTLDYVTMFMEIVCSFYIQQNNFEVFESLGSIMRIVVTNGNETKSSANDKVSEEIATREQQALKTVHKICQNNSKNFVWLLEILSDTKVISKESFLDYYKHMNKDYRDLKDVASFFANLSKNN